MEETQGHEPHRLRTEDPGSTGEVPPLTDAVAPQVATGSCPTCAAAQTALAPPPTSQSQYIYAIGNVEPRFPNLSVEKEMAQAIARAGGNTVNLNDRQATVTVLQEPENKYLIRELCWVFSVQGVETYILLPRDSADYMLLLEAYGDSLDPGNLEAVVGVRGPVAPPTMCNGLTVPIVMFDEIYSLTRQQLVDRISDSIAKSMAITDPNQPVDPEKVKQLAGSAKVKQLADAAGDVFDQVIQQSDNAGATDEHRALNYLACRYDKIYVTAANAFASNGSLTSINVLPSPLNGTRKIVDVVFAFTDRVKDVTSKYFVRVDVTEKYPFLIGKISPYYDR